MSELAPPEPPPSESTPSDPASPPPDPASPPSAASTSTPSSTTPPSLDATFGRAARIVRGRLWLRRVLTGTAIGLAAGAPVSAALWWLRQGELRPLAASLGLLGATFAAYVAARKRWSDQDVALYLDAQLGGREQVVTAIGLRASTAANASATASPSASTAAQRAPARPPAQRAPKPSAAVAPEAAQHIRAQAAQLLAARPRLPGPKVWDAPQLLAPFGAAAIVWLTLTPLPAAPHIFTPPGAERIQPKDVKGLERIEALKNQKGRSPEDERRLRALAEDAKKLRGELNQGMEKREALSRLAKLRDAIAELRSEFGNKQNRPGLEAAIGALAEHPEMRKAARALGDGDITAFDREMQRLANQAEQRSRESAKQALEEAEKAARQRGAQSLADALKEQGKAFQQRAAEAEALRELGKALQGQLDAQALEDLKEFGSSGNPEAARRLADAMGKALAKLSEEERKRLAEQLKRQIEGAPGQSAASPMTRQELEDLAKRLGSPQGQKELEQRLRDLANPQPTPEAGRDGALDDAERGLGEAERGLGATPLPMPGGDPAPGNPGNAPGGDAQDQANGAPGSGRDTGTGKHAGESKTIDAPELRAKANAQRSGTGPMHAATLGRAPARAGDTANQRGAGSLGSVAPAEIGAVEQSEVPEEYREHVGRYFEP